MRFPLAVVEEVRRVIATHADRPFVLVYRILAEEPEDGGLRIGDTLVLVERLVEGRQRLRPCLAPGRAHD